jgi:hypothetical protein
MIGVPELIIRQWGAWAALSSVTHYVDSSSGETVPTPCSFSGTYDLTTCGLQNLWALLWTAAVVQRPLDISDFSKILVS